MGKVKQAKIEETLSTTSSARDDDVQSSNIIPTYDNVPAMMKPDESHFISTDIPQTETMFVPSNTIPDLHVGETIIPKQENLDKLKEINNGDGLAETPIKPEQKASFIEGLIKKPIEDIKVLDGESYSDIVSSSAKQSATNYARRNIVSLKDKVAEVLARKSNVDAVNIEERGVFKCHPDKPIKN